VDIILRYADSHATIVEGDPVKRPLSGEHRVDVDDDTGVRLLVGIGMVLHKVVHLELGLLMQLQLPKLPTGLPKLPEVKREGEAIVIHRVDIPVDVLN